MYIYTNQKTNFRGIIVIADAQKAHCEESFNW
jgi:hypothetical protein